MKRVLSIVLVLSMAMMWVGCQKAAESPAPPPDGGSTEAAPTDEPSTDTTNPQSSVTEETSSEFTLVTLKVPNMT